MHRGSAEIHKEIKLNTSPSLRLRRENTKLCTLLTKNYIVFIPIKLSALATKLQTVFCIAALPLCIFVVEST